MSTEKTQHGQIIVLFALVLVGLLAFAGLAIDSAMVYSDRRADQSAADSAALAGAGAGATYMQLHDVNFKHDFDCADLNIIGQKMNEVKHEILDAAITRAGANGVIIDSDLTDNHGVRVTCVSSGNDKYLDIEVRITTQTDTSFLQIVSGQPLVNTVTAIARVRPTRPSAGGFAIAATDKNDCNQNSGGVWFDGNVTTVLDGGGVYSGTCIAKNGKSGTIQVKNSDPGVARTKLLNVEFIDENGKVDNPVIDPKFELDIQIPAPNCAGLPTDPAKVGGNYQPGIYTNGFSEKTVVLAPGLYCIDADVKSGDITGYGVTLYFRNGASLKLTGNETLNATAPSAAHPPVGNSMMGLLMYYDTGDFEMAGNGEANLVGTIYAPAGEVKLGGTSDLKGTFTTEIIADHVKIHGNPGTGIQYDASQFFQRPPTLDLMR
jgi:hypothetical protein